MKNLEPEVVWNYFQNISEIPRCSGNEKKIRNYILSVAERNDCETKVDEVGNVLVKKGATVEREVPITILQGHMDMVCEKDEDTEHDFTTDSIELKKEGQWITANGTTLGADNGIGLAMALAVIDKDLTHGPLEFLFTISEETGLDGAKNLKPDFIEGRTLINLDSEEFGSFTIGCAGGGDSEISLPINYSETEKGDFVEIKIKGLKGGHSGLDIDKGRANSIKLLARLLWELNQKTEAMVHLKDIKGGNKRNAIPREAKAVIKTSLAYDEIEKVLENIFSNFKEEYISTEPNMKLKIKRIENEDHKIIPFDISKKIIEMIRALPHGVLFMSQEVPGLVRTSTNLATISFQNGNLEIALKTRSNSKSELQATRDRIRAIAENFGAEVNEDTSYPGWEPNMDSDILKKCKEVYNDLFNEEPTIEALHAGLETGLIGEKFEGMDMISLGATIEDPHSTSEKLHVGSVEKTWKFLTTLLERLT